MIFHVWAPAADSVELVLADRKRPMLRGEHGHWSVEVELDGEAARNDYGFVIDGEGPFPDPRSLRQPSGPHGLSRVFDPATIRWTDADWRPPPLANGVIYELNIGTFTRAGTLDAAATRLRHLVDLGVTHVELMPVAQFPGGHGWGYDGVDLYAVHEAWGGPAALARFVDAAHAHGLAVLLDVVYNHLGPDGNYLPRYAPYFTDAYTTPWGSALNFDGRGSDDVRRFLIDNALHWLRDFHIDGLRLDAVHAILDRSAVHFLEQLASEVRALERTLGRDLLLIAENARNDPRVIRPVSHGGYGLDAQWSDDFHHALHVTMTGERAGYYADYEPWTDLARVFATPHAYDGRYSPFRGHSYGAPAADLPPSRFVVAMQNHDQIGNRAVGDRISHIVSCPKTMVGAALTLLSPWVPLIFQGEEWAATSPFQYFTDHVDEALAEAVRQGRRREFAEFGWPPERVPDPQDPATVWRSTLDWTELAHEPHAGMLEWYRSLIALRRATKFAREPGAGSISVRVNEEAEWIVVDRGPFLIAANLSSEERTVQLRRRGELLLGSAEGVCVTGESIVLPPESVGVVGDGGSQSTASQPTLPFADST